MIKMFEEFVNFCFEHGGTLRNHKRFGEMAQALMTKMTQSQPINFLEELGILKQEAKDRKTSADDGEVARNWAIVHTELQKVYAFVREYLPEEEE